ncbi:MAG TPA: NAD-dependent epimerase/dehydratase family protein [Polyangia bacterium]|nr:NAD-dependent epimerase/dehydratase family protein [Polyangia bacterium]
MRVLIIGGTGLISTAIVEQLLERGDEVTLFNRGLSEIRFAGADRVRILRGDRRDFAAFEAEMARHTFDSVIDMVAFAPAEADSLLRAFTGRARQIVVCSTVCVYGGPMTRLPASDDEPHRPVTDYGRNKSAIERTLLAASGRDGLATTVLRPSFTTGAGHTLAGSVMFDDTTLERLRQGLPVIVHDDGQTPWAIAHVSDVARGFVGALLNPKAYGQAYHLTSDEHTTWDGVWQAMIQAAGGQRPSPIVHIPTRFLAEVAPRRAVGVKFIYQYASTFDNGKAARDLGFRTTVPLVETFRRQIAWMESAGRVTGVDEDRFQDVLIEAFEKRRPPAPGRLRDFNPWGNDVRI